MVPQANRCVFLGLCWESHDLSLLLRLRSLKLADLRSGVALKFIKSARIAHRYFDLNTVCTVQCFFIALKLKQIITVQA